MSWLVWVCAFSKACGQEELSISVPPKGSAVKGRMLLPDGQPAGGAPVYVFPNSRYLESSPIVEGKSNDDGAFFFGSLSPGMYYLVCGEQLAGKRIEIEEGRILETEVMLPQQPVDVKGEISHKNGAVQSGRIRFIPLSPQRSRLVWPPPVYTSIITDGNYEVKGMVAGQYLLNVEAEIREEHEEPEKNNIASFVKIIRVNEKQKTLSLQFPEFRFTGTISDFEGRPVASGFLYLIPSDIEVWSARHYMSFMTVTDRDGNFSFEHVENANYDLVLEAVEEGVGIQARTGIQVNAEAPELHWQMDEAVEIEVDASVEDKMLLQNGEVRLMAICTDQPRIRSASDHTMSFDSAPGSFVPRLFFPKGQYTIFGYVYESKRAMSYESISLTFNRGRDVRLNFVQAGKISVAVKGSLDRRSGRTVRLLDAYKKEISRLYDPRWSYNHDLRPVTVLPTDGTGKTEIDGIAPGRYYITLDGEDVSREAVVRSGKTTNIELLVPALKNQESGVDGSE
jgi:hypothetical protein